MIPNIYGKLCNSERDRLPPPRSRVPLPSSCTPTSTTERPENVYFPYTALNLNPSDNARFEGITPRRPSENVCMCCMRCTHCLHHVRFDPCTFLVSLAANSWDIRNPGSPHHLLHAPDTFPLHRYLHELPEPICCVASFLDSLP